MNRRKLGQPVLHDSYADFDSVGYEMNKNEGRRSFFEAPERDQRAEQYYETELV